MEVKKKYKIYAHIFYGYILAYLFFMMYVIGATQSITLKFILNDGGLFFIIYLTLVFINKSRLYIRQIKNGNFGFFSESFFKPSKMTQVLGSFKSFIGIIIYFIFHLFLVSWLTFNLNKINPDATFLLTVLYASYIIFPISLIAWDIKRLRFWPLINKEKIKKSRQEQLANAKNMEKYENRQFKPEMLGTMTGYEPKELEKIELTPTPHMKGEPGAGLSGSSFSEANIESGALGELNFAKALQENDYLEKFATYWSIQYPLEYSPGPYLTRQADIDCVLISKNTIYLVDLKLYFQGNITWKTISSKNTIQAVDNLTGNWVKEPIKMSGNMYDDATERIQAEIDQLGIKMKVKPYVVMMPTDSGLGKVENVFWPGQVPCVTLMDFLKIIETDKPYNDQSEDAEIIDSVFAWLIKDESGSAPRFNG